MLRAVRGAVVSSTAPRVTAAMCQSACPMWSEETSL